MTVFMVETYVVKPEKQAEFTAWKKTFLPWREKHPELFKEMKSNRLFAQVFGGNMGGYVEMSEFENLADCEKCFATLMQSEYMTTRGPEFLAFIVPATYSISIWSPVE